MTHSELLLWPIANNWGELRRSALEQHMGLYLTVYPNEHTCAIWAEVVDQCRRIGRRIQTADARIASAARQWDCPFGDDGFPRLCGN
ncbi:MAG: hypothetical protein WBY44_01895 [Bryobacteraceae bacterium]